MTSSIVGVEQISADPDIGTSHAPCTHIIRQSYYIATSHYL
jgi:hypothetical protein